MILGGLMTKITLYAQPMGSEPYLNMSTFGVVDKAESEQYQNIKALTDVGRKICETAQALDDEASIAGTSIEGSSFDWGLRIDMKNLKIEMNCKSYTDEPMTVKDHIVKLIFRGDLDSIQAFVQKFVSDLNYLPFEINNWDYFSKSEKVSKDEVVADWNKVLSTKEGAPPAPEPPPAEAPASEPTIEEAPQDFPVPGIEPVPPKLGEVPPSKPLRPMPKKKRRIKLKVKKKGKADTRPCPRCKEIVPVDPTQDPIVFECPNCGLKGKFKRKKKIPPAPKPKMVEKTLEEAIEKPGKVPIEEEVEKKVEEIEKEPEPEVTEPEEEIPEVKEPEPEAEPEVKEPEEETPEVKEPEPKAEPEVEEPEEEIPEVKESEPEPEAEVKEPEEEIPEVKEPEPEAEPEPIPEPPKVSPEERLEEFLDKAERYKNRNQYHDAVRYYDMVLDIDPNHTQALNNKGLILWANRKYKLAIEHFDHILELDPKNQEAIINKAASFNRLGEKDKAIKLYDELLEDDKTNADAWSNKGVILFSQQRYEEAEKCFKNAVENNPDDEDSWFNYAFVLEKLDKFQEATDAYETVLKLNPGNSEATRAYHQCLKVLRREMLKDWQ